MRKAQEKTRGLLLWQIFLFLGVLAVGGYFLLPGGGLLEDLSYDMLGVAAVAAIVAGVRRNRPRRAAAWYVFASGVSLLVAGDIVWNVYENVLGVPAPFPSVADGFYLAGYPPMAAGLLMMIHSRGAGHDRPALVDAAIISVSGGMLSWVFLMSPYATDPSMSFVERAISVAYPLMDVVLLAAAARLVFAPGWRTPAGYLLIFGLASYLAADLTYSRAILAGTYQNGDPLDAGWLLAYVFAGAAALHPAMRSLTAPLAQDKDTSFSQARIAVLILASLALPVTLALHESRDNHGGDVLALALGTVIVFTLVLLRFGDLARRLQTTERTMAEEKLRKAETKYRTLVEHVPAITYVHAQEPGDTSTTNYISPQIETVLGYTPEEYTSDPDFWKSVLHPDDRERVLAEDERTNRTGEPFSIEYRRRVRDGNYIWVRDEAALVYDREGKPRYWQGFLWNIADRKEAEEKLREAELLYRTLIEQIPVVTYTQNLERELDEVVFMSPQIEQITGYTPEEFMTDSSLWDSIVHPEDYERMLAEDERTDQTGEPYYVEYRMIHRNGDVAWVRDEAVIVRDAEGRPLQWRGIMLDITAQKGLEDELSHQASHDALTELPNRALFTDRLQHALALGNRQEKRSIAVMFVDLDNFKNVNDSLGHAAGDQLLIEVAARLSSCVRPADTVARLGGDEFAILMEEVPKEVPNPPKDPDGGWSAAGAAIQVAQRILDSLETPFSLQGNEVHVRPSIGIATDTGEKRADDLLQNADVAMYTAKNRGKGRYEFYDPAMHAAALGRLRLSADLRQAVARKEFVVHYQPIVHLGGESGEGAKIREIEALVRWEHPEKGMISPASFIPLAEETGDIVGIGLLVLEEACRQQARRWRDSDPEAADLTLSVNLSARQFRQPDLAEQVSSILQKTGLPANSLKLEVTESAAMENVEVALAILRKLRNLGVKIAVDDFGTGYSSLSHLSRFPVDTLKVDRSFVNRLKTDPESAAIVSTTVTLAQELGLSTTAEGVETVEQLAKLRELGCDYAQGYYFSRPLPAEEIQDHLDALAIHVR